MQSFSMFAGYFLCAQRENESIRPISFNGPLPSRVSKASQQLKPVLSVGSLTTSYINISKLKRYV